MTTTLPEATRSLGLTSVCGGGGSALVASYQAIISDERLSWTAQHRMLRLLGRGGQGVVYLSERHGIDGFTLPVALKIFSPQHYPAANEYDEDMERIAHVAARVAQIQHDNLLDVHNFIAHDRIRIMEMEWIDGYDLRELLTGPMLERARQRIRRDQWDYLNDVVVTAGPMQPRLKPGIAIQVLRECLAALASLHREGIVHGDIKPANIMLKRTGHAKLIDIGSAVDRARPTRRRMCSPAYAAPEVLGGAGSSPQSDLASMGYVVVEMLAGQPPFLGLNNHAELVDAKRQLGERLFDLLPRDVVRDELLLNLCQGMVAPDPCRRFPSAEAADLDRAGAAGFHRQLVKGGLASEYENDIRVWLGHLA